MANVIEEKVGTSQPVPVSDDEIEGEYNSPVGSPKIVDRVESPRQNFISPASSPENFSKIDNISENCGSDKEHITNPNGTCEADDDGAPDPDARAEVENVSPPLDESLQQPIVVDDIGIAKEMNEYIKINKINFCELEHLEELWAICDAISAAHSGLPDSLLKDAFLLVLEGHLSRQKQGFLRQHLDHLIKQWKMEVQSEKSTDRPTKFIAACVDYTPPVVKKRRSNASRKRALIRRMGVGDILQQARVLCSTESGDYDVEENEHGSFTIGGQELTFESWGELTRTKDDGVFYDPAALAMTRRPRKRKAAAGAANQSNLSADVSNMSTTYSASSSFTSHNNTTITGADMSLVSTTSSTPTKGKNGTTKRAPKPPKEKDEGELTESGGDSDSASSTSSEEDVTTMHSKKRRKKRRQTERNTATSSLTNIADVVHKAYQYRGQIAHALTFSQKAAFLECLKQQNNGSAGNGGARLQQISQLMAMSKAGVSGSPAH